MALLQEYGSILNLHKIITWGGCRNIFLTDPNVIKPAKANANTVKLEGCRIIARDTVQRVQSALA